MGPHGHHGRDYRRHIRRWKSLRAFGGTLRCAGWSRVLSWVGLGGVGYFHACRLRAVADPVARPDLEDRAPASMANGHGSGRERAPCACPARGRDEARFIGTETRSGVRASCDGKRPGRALLDLRRAHGWRGRGRAVGPDHHGGAGTRQPALGLAVCLCTPDSRGRDCRRRADMRPPASIVVLKPHILGARRCPIGRGHAHLLARRRPPPPIVCCAASRQANGRSRRAVEGYLRPAAGRPVRAGRVVPRRSRSRPQPDSPVVGPGRVMRGGDIPERFHLARRAHE